MRVFVAGATGAIGRQLLPLLVAAGHEVAGMTRRPERVDALRAAGATPVVCDVFDAEALAREVAAFAPDTVLYQVTDLPQRKALLPLKLLALNRVRTQGADNIVAAAQVANGARVLAQSVAFPLPGIAQRAVDHLEAAVLGADGVVLRYGQFYGPGTWSERPPAKGPRVHVATAAARTVEALCAPTGVIEVVDVGDPPGAR